MESKATKVPGSDTGVGLTVGGATGGPSPSGENLSHDTQAPAVPAAVTFPLGKPPSISFVNHSFDTKNRPCNVEVKLNMRRYTEDSTTQIDTPDQILNLMATLLGKDKTCITERILTEKLPFQYTGVTKMKREAEKQYCHRRTSELLRAYVYLSWRVEDSDELEAQDAAKNAPKTAKVTMYTTTKNEQLGKTPKPEQPSGNIPPSGDENLFRLEMENLALKNKQLTRELEGLKTKHASQLEESNAKLKEETARRRKAEEKNRHMAEKMEALEARLQKLEEGSETDVLTDAVKKLIYESVQDALCALLPPTQSVEKMNYAEAASKPAKAAKVNSVQVPKMDTRVSKSKMSTKMLILPQQENTKVVETMREKKLRARDLGVQNVVEYPSGAALLIVDQDKAEDTLKKIEEAGLRQKVSKMLSRKSTTFRIHDVPASTSEDEVREEVHAELGHEPRRVLFFQYRKVDQQKKVKIALIEGDEDLMEAARKTRHISISFNYCRIDLTENLMRCKLCKTLGHTRNHCPGIADSLRQKEGCMDCIIFNERMKSAGLPRSRHRRIDHPIDSEQCPTRRSAMKKLQKMKSQTHETTITLEDDPLRSSPQASTSTRVGASSSPSAREVPSKESPVMESRRPELYCETASATGAEEMNLSIPLETEEPESWQVYRDDGQRCDTCLALLYVEEISGDCSLCVCGIQDGRTRLSDAEIDARDADIKAWKEHEDTEARKRARVYLARIRELECEQS